MHYFRWLVLIILSVTNILVDPLQRMQTTTGLTPNNHLMVNSLIVSIWNVHNQKDWLQLDNQTQIEKQFTHTSLSKSDLIALQETSEIDELTIVANRHNYQIHGKRNSIFSRYPVINKGETTINARGRSAFWVDVHFKDKMIRLYSIHLSYKQQNWPFIPEIRGAEIKEVIKHAETFNGPVIIAGDFNTLSLFNPDLSSTPVFQNLKKAGYQSSRPLHACKSQIPLGQQDWIFFKHANVLRFVCGNYAGSDHRWIQVELEF